MRVRGILLMHGFGIASWSTALANAEASPAGTMVLPVPHRNRDGAREDHASSQEYTGEAASRASSLVQETITLRRIAWAAAKALRRTSFQSVYGGFRAL